MIVKSPRTVARSHEKPANHGPGKKTSATKTHFNSTDFCRTDQVILDGPVAPILDGPVARFWIMLIPSLVMVGSTILLRMHFAVDLLVSAILLIPFVWFFVDRKPQ